MADPNSVVQELINKTLHELNTPPQNIQQSRVSNTSNGYIHLVVWSNASLYRIMVRKFTDTLNKSEHRLKAQFDDNARSTVANIEEGFARANTLEYLNFLGYSRASLIEGKGDAQRCLQDGFLVSVPGSNLSGIGINLMGWHEALKKTVISKPEIIKGFYGNLEDIRSERQIVKPFLFNYSPVDKLKPEVLTYEMFIEIINKTDWNIKRLVVSLENKLAKDSRYYQVERARYRNFSKFR